MKTKKNRSLAVLLLCVVTFNIYSMDNTWKSFGWAELVGSVILGIGAIRMLFYEPPREPFLLRKEKPFGFTDLPKDQQSQIIQLLSLNTNAESLEAAAKIINSLAQVNHELNELINDPAFCLKLIKHFAKKFNCSERRVTEVLQTKEAKRLVALEKEYHSKNILAVSSTKNLLDFGSEQQKKKMLFEMCRKGDIDGVSALLDNGVNVNTRYTHGSTPLHIACKNGNKELVYYLAKHGADIYAVDDNGLTPFHIVFNKGYIDIADYLFSVAGSLVNVKKAQDQVIQIKPDNMIAPEKNVVTQILPQQPFNEAENQNFSGQSSNIKITRTDSSIHIYEYSNTPGYYTETILFRDCQGCLPPGVYYRTPNGLQCYNGTLMSNNGIEMYNPLLNLEYTRIVWAKNDLRHNFPTEVDEEAGSWARIVIHNAINNPNAITGSKKFDLHITIPGQINEVDNSTGQAIITNQLFGVFEFEVRKDLYQQEGKCFHRFFAPKGMVGAEKFGIKARNKIMNQ